MVSAYLRNIGSIFGDDVFQLKSQVVFVGLLLLLGWHPGSCFSAQSETRDYVVLIHGLGRTSQSLHKMAHRLGHRGYQVINIDYPSRQYDIQTLTSAFIHPAIQKGCVDKTRRVHFVTHSMGGIIVRYYLKTNPMENIGRIVMLSPPNRGSEVVDFLKDRTIIRKIMGPAFGQLSTDSAGFLASLGTTGAEVGVITGKRSINWINSIIIPGKDDGKVSVERAKLKKMRDFLVVNRTHSFIMNANEVIAGTIHFIENGNFNGSD